MTSYVNFLRDGLVYIPGESKDDGHNGWVEAVSLQVRSAPPPEDSDSGSDQKSPSSAGELIIVKAMDFGKLENRAGLP